MFIVRKGIDLVAQILPTICKMRFRHGSQVFKVNFIVAGDGPKRIVLEEVIEKNKLQKR
jgi:phosphatidylinositol glycan class A protein